MITVMIEKKRDELGVYVAGHAGYAQKGADIVCAGASMLFDALAAGCESLGAVTGYSAQNGRAQLTFRRDDRTEAGLHFFRAGILRLCERYPDHVGFVREKNESDSDKMDETEVSG